MKFLTLSWYSWHISYFLPFFFLYNLYKKVFNLSKGREKCPSLVFSVILRDYGNCLYLNLYSESVKHTFSSYSMPDPWWVHTLGGAIDGKLWFQSKHLHESVWIYKVPSCRFTKETSSSQVQPGFAGELGFAYLLTLSSGCLCAVHNLHSYIQWPWELL